MALLFFALFLGLWSQHGHAFGLSVVQSTDGRPCLFPFALEGSTNLNFECSTQGNGNVARCAVDLDPSTDQGTSFANCGILAPCINPDANDLSKMCQDFTYKGEDYIAGVCTYQDSYSGLPWCSIKPGQQRFRQFNEDWTYCSNPVCKPLPLP